MTIQTNCNNQMRYDIQILRGIFRTELLKLLQLLLQQRYEPRTLSAHMPINKHIIARELNKQTITTRVRNKEKSQQINDRTQSSFHGNDSFNTETILLLIPTDLPTYRKHPKTHHISNACTIPERGKCTAESLPIAKG